ncbi:SKIP interacting protein 16 [Rhynchospora pubera]|uniref:SKIP interacting protein 16 n=1 Tax=Rhynchospora pubera TaxID=906938 RepID=A0AAV8ECH4_9POAL|nr:SKIP interacting protein 16 [Rhynchospora pubera]
MEPFVQFATENSFFKCTRTRGGTKDSVELSLLSYHLPTPPSLSFVPLLAPEFRFLSTGMEISEISPEVDDYIKESIEISLGLPISEKNMQLKIVALEDTRHRLQSQIFELEDRLILAKAEANLNAQGLRRSIEDKEKILSEYAQLQEHHSKLEEGFKRTVEACDELERDNEELYAKLIDSSKVRVDLMAQVESLKVEKEQLLVNLNKAEEEVVLLSKENKILEREKKVFAEHFKRRQLGHDPKLPASSAAKIKGKSGIRKSTAAGRLIDSDKEDARDPLTPINFNSPELDAFHPSV